MKRAGNLIEQIADPDNLRLAWLKTIRGKRERQAVLRFREHLWENLDGMASDFLRGEYRWGGYTRFMISDPKEREIKAAPIRDRIAFHAISNAAGPVFERYQIDQSCACRKGKGQTEAVRLASSYSRSGRWFLKLDIHKYYDSIPHEKLKEALRRLFKDGRLLLLFDTLIDTYHKMPGRGIPIGNLTSQYFANHYLGILDHFIKEEVRCRSYVRYMDDFVLWEDRKENLRGHQKQIEDFLHRHLDLRLNTPCLNRIERGLPFLGYRVYPGHIRLSPRSRLRFRKKFLRAESLFLKGIWNEEELARHIVPLFAFVQRSESWSFRSRVLKKGIEP